MAEIFVVDDDRQLLKMVGIMLERGGHTPTLIDDPGEGLNRILAEKPDLVILDVMMPGLSGHDICRQIRANKETAHIPVLILTARSQEIDRQTALKSGADDYLSKPVNSQELIEHIGSLLGRKQTGSLAGRAATVISILGLRGGSGRTTAAVNLATALRRSTKEEVCLLELTPSGSQAATHLRLPASRSWLDLVDKELKWESLRSCLLTHRSGLQLLASPALPGKSDEPAGSFVEQALKILKANMLFVVVDLPAMLNPAAMAALQTTDLLLHLVTPELIAVQTASQTNRALHRHDIKIKQKFYILNQTTAEAQLPQAAVEKGLKGRISFQIGYDANQSRALAQGMPLTFTAAQSPLPVAMRRMAEAIWQRVQHEQPA